MATVRELENAQSLVRLDPQLEPEEQAWRTIYLSPQLRDWLRDVLPGLKPAWETEVACDQQLDAFVEVFCAGQRLNIPQHLHPIVHVADGIWVLKTGDLRIFGWFHAKDCFIAWRGEHADHVKEHNLYHSLAGETARFRERLDLNEPKFIAGVDPHAVLWNYS